MPVPLACEPAESQSQSPIPSPPQSSPSPSPPPAAAARLRGSGRVCCDPHLLLASILCSIFEAPIGLLFSLARRSTSSVSYSHLLHLPPPVHHVVDSLQRSTQQARRLFSDQTTPGALPSTFWRVCARKTQFPPDCPCSSVPVPRPSRVRDETSNADLSAPPARNRHMHKHHSLLGRRPPPSLATDRTLAVTSAKL